MLTTWSTTRVRSVIAITAVGALLAACGGNTSDEADSVDSAPLSVESDEAPEPDTSSNSEPAAEPVVTAGQVIEDVVEEDPTETPVPGGTLRFGLEADVDGLNPTASALPAAGSTMGNVVFDTLAAFDADGNAVPYLAESIEPVDGDLTRWRVTVREGVTFHDGAALDATAVAANFETQLANPLVGLALRPFFPAEGAITLIDDQTVEYKTLDPTANFGVMLTTQVGMVASPTWLAAATADPTLNQQPVGTGPFRFESRSEDSLTSFVRNDEWWGGDVYLDAIEFLPVPDPAARNDLLFNGDIDGLHTPDPGSVDDLRDTDGVQNVEDETGEEVFVMLNSAAPPFDDIRARRAFTLATPLENFRDLIGLGVARGADQMFIPESPFFNPDVVQEGDDPDGAVALAAAYCADVPDNCTDGKINVVFQYPGGSVTQARSAEILDEGWSVAFNVQFDELLQDAHTRQVVFGQYQAALWRQFGGLDPALNRTNLVCRTIDPGLSLNFPRYCSEERDAFIFESQLTEDIDARVPLWQGVVQDMHDAYTYVFLTHTVWDTAFDSSVRGACSRTSPDGAALRCVANGQSWFSSIWLDE